MLALLPALAAATPGDGLGCPRLLATEVGAALVEDLRRVARAWGKDAASVRIKGVLATAGWRPVWADTSGAKSGVFFFQRTGSRYTYRNVWGGSLADDADDADDADAADAVQWVEKLGAPHALAQCFVAQLRSEGL